MTHLRALAVLLAFLAGSSHAATFHVTNTNGSGPGSFREAVLNTSSGDTVVFFGAIFLLPQTITLNAELAKATGFSVVNSPANAQVTIKADFRLGVLGDTVSFTNVRLWQSSFDFDNHSAVRAALAFTDCTFSDCGNMLVEGDANLTLLRCTVDRMAIYALEVNVLLEDSTFTGTGPVGWTYRDHLTMEGGTLIARTCTFANSSDDAIRALGEYFVDGDYRTVPPVVTVTGCSFSSVSIGIAVSAGTLTVDDCTFTGNALGISASSTEAEVTNSEFTGQTSYGVFGSHQPLTVTDCEFRNNGGGIRGNYGVTMTVTRCTISDNHVTGEGNGGGIEAFYESELTVIDSVITNNSSEGTGGGIGGSPSPVIIRGCTIAGNTAAIGGGVNGGDLSITASTISGNTATDEGGGVYSHTGNVKIVNSTLSGNVAGRRGGALLTYYQGEVTILNSTITGNSAENYGGLVNLASLPIEVGNSIVAGNISTASDTNASTGRDLQGDFLSLGHNLIGVAPAASDFTHGVDGDLVGTAASPVDPLLGPLANNGGPTRTHALRYGSPAIESADSGLVAVPLFPAPPFTDQRGQPRIVGGVADMGAYEFPSLEVTNPNDSGAGSLRDRVSLANSAGGGVITFRESVFGSTLQTIALTSGQLPLSSAISIVGPEIGVRISGSGSSRIFNITAAGVALKHLRITDGNSITDGGGIRVAGAGTDVALEDVALNNCVAAGRGGGLYAQDNSVVSITRSTISANDADDNGGGINLQSNTLLRMTNSTLSGNRSKQNGGGLFAISGTFTLINCTITANRADFDGVAPVGDGGGIRSGGGTGSLRVGNTIIAGNADDSAGTVHRDVSGIFESLGHNLIGVLFGLDADGGVPFANGVNGDQTGTIASPLDPQFASLAFVPTVATTRVHTIAASSPARNAGDEALLTHGAWPSAPATDQRGQARSVNGGVDIGAVEWPDAEIVSLALVAGPAYERGPRAGKFRIRRTFDDGAPAVVTMAISSASTASAADYVISGAAYASTGPATFEVTIPAGREYAQFSVTPTGDSAVEGTEVLTLTPLGGAGYVVDSAVSNARTLNLLDDEFIVTSSASSGAGSLRAALSGARDAGGGDITIPTALSISLGGTPLTVGSGIVISGNGTTIEGGGLSRVLDIEASGGALIVLRDLIIRGGRSPVGENGGGIRVPPAAALLIERCAITANVAEERGGGLYADGATVSVKESAIHFNAALAGDGGGVGVAGGTVLSLANTTIAQNATNHDGGGLAVRNAIATLVHCTVTQNVADYDNSGLGDVGGIFNDVGSEISLGNTAATDNTDTPGGTGIGTLQHDVGGDGAWVSLGHNCIGRHNGAASAFPAGSPNAGTDYAGTNASPLDAGLVAVPGAYLRFEFGLESVLVDHGDNTLATTPTDQRGYPRIHNATADIGAVEMDFFVVTNAAATGAGSLRRAISDANALGHGVVAFDPAFFTGPRTIVITSGGQLAVTASLTIDAPASASRRVTVSGNGASRVLNLAPASAATVTLRNLTLAGGNTASHLAADRDGAAIRVGANAALTMSGCEIRDCTAAGNGGGVAVMPASSLSAVNCTFAANHAIHGGGLSIEALATLTNCTLSANQASGKGGGIFESKPLGSATTLEHCTITQNTATSLTAGVATVSGGLQVRNCLVAGNDLPGSPDDDAAGAFASLGHNLLGVTAGATGFTPGVNGDLTGVPVSLGPLQNNGGPTRTHALLVGSAALHAAAASAITTDQRGQPRNAGLPDIGAYELVAETYAYWAAHTFPTATAAGAADDFDGDGASNALEFGTGSDPLDGRSRPAVRASRAGPNVAFDFTASPLAPARFTVLRLSTDLATWVSAADSLYQVTGFDPAGNVVLYRITLPLTLGPRLFGRVERVP